MRRPRRFSLDTEWVALAAVLLAMVVVRWSWLDFHLDDSYITYTYARSLAEGQGLTFAGTRVLGTTTPLYAGMLAALAVFHVPLTVAAKLWGLLGVLAGGATLYLLTREHLGRTGALLAVGLLALNGVHASMSMSGMETGIYTAVCLAAFLAFRRGHPRLTAALTAAACLLRPDGILLAAILGIACVWERRSFHRKTLFWFVAPLLAWGLIATLTYGSPVPTSLSAKLAYPDYGPFSITAAFRAVGERLGLFVLVLGGFGLMEVQRRARPLLPLVAWTALYLLAFLRAPNFLWYYVPALPGLIVVGVTGLARLARVLPQPAAFPAHWFGHLRRTAAFLVCAALFLTASADLRDHREFLARTHGPEVTGTYRGLAEWLKRNTAPEAVIATPEVGYIGYFSGRAILDLAGLCTPEVIPYLKRRDYAAIVRDFHPDYVALTTEGGRPIHRAILQSPWFAERYTECARFPYRGAAYVIFGRKQFSGK